MKRVILIAWLAAFATVLQAAPILGCGATTTICNGNEYALSFVGQVENTYTLQLDILITDDYTGTHWTDKVVSIGLKDFATGTITNHTLLVAPTALGNWTLTNEELNANGCGGGSGAQRMCAEVDTFANGAGFPSGAGTLLSWLFSFETTGTLNDTAHLKYVYASGGSNGAWDKVGDLGSWDIEIQRPPGDEPSVPEPATIGVTIAGLALIVATRLGRKP